VGQPQCCEWEFHFSCAKAPIFLYLKSRKAVILALLSDSLSTTDLIDGAEI
jgi:hypothetical protein